MLLSWEVFVYATPCAAQESVTARLEWQQEPGAEECLDGNALERAVNRRWGRNVFFEAADADILLKGTVRRSEHDGWTVSLTLYRADETSLGSRDLITAARSCSSLDDSVALAVGLMLDVSRHRIVEERRASAEQTTRPQETSQGTSTTREAAEPLLLHERVVDGPRISVPEETPPSREFWRAGPSIGMETAVGLLPSWGVAPRVGLAVTPPRFVPVELALSVFIANEERASGGRGARFSAWTAEVAVCPASVRGRALRFRADSCLVERLGEVRAAGFGFTEDATATELVSTIGARETGTIALVGPLSAFLSLGVEAPFVRYRFVFGESSGGTRSVHQMAPVVGAGTVGLLLEW